MEIQIQKLYSLVKLQEKRKIETGIPFVGAAGKFLAEMLASIGMKREDVYITNIVKYRPPENRDPTPLEKQQCAIGCAQNWNLLNQSWSFSWGATV
jgi:uracil-DNA glycosylase family 4